MVRRTRPPLPACLCSAAMAALSPDRPSPLTAARSTTNGRRVAAVQGSRSGNNDPTTLRHLLPVLAGRQGWPAIARLREVCACSLSRLRWNAPQKLMGYGSTPSIPESSTRRFGRSYRYRRDAMCRLIRTRWPKQGYRQQGWAGAGYRERGSLPRL
jgi:hypothetical protein